MKRIITISNNTLIIAADAIAVPDLTFFKNSSPVPLFTLSIQNQEVKLDLSNLAKKHYETIEGPYTHQGKLGVLINLLTRTRVNSKTDMHCIVNQFINQKITTGTFIFDNQGNLEQEHAIQKIEMN